MIAVPKQHYRKPYKVNHLIKCLSCKQCVCCAYCVVVVMCVCAHTPMCVCVCHRAASPVDIRPPGPHLVLTNAQLSRLAV